MEKEIELNKIHNLDCLEFIKTLPDKCIDLIITSPPYNKSFYDTRKKQGGKNDVWKQRKISYDNFNDNMKPKEYEKWQKKVIKECLRILKPTGSLFYNHKTFSNNHLLVYPTYVFDFPLKQIITWDRGSTPQINPCRFYPTTELIFWFSKTATQPYFNNENTTYKNEVWRINAKPMKDHPAPFPEELVINILKSCSKEGDIIYDPFAGSGTTAVVCKMLGRNYILNEISPEYCKIAEERIKSISNTLF